jgi:hypothetical protein
MTLFSKKSLFLLGIASLAAVIGLAVDSREKCQVALAFFQESPQIVQNLKAFSENPVARLELSKTALIPAMDILHRSAQIVTKGPHFFYLRKREVALFEPLAAQNPVKNPDAFLKALEALARITPDRLSCESETRAPASRPKKEGSLTGGEWVYEVSNQLQQVKYRDGERFEVRRKQWDEDRLRYCRSEANLTDLRRVVEAYRTQCPSCRDSKYARLLARQRDLESVKSANRLQIEQKWSPRIYRGLTCQETH